jgi:hypothetical protein
MIENYQQYQVTQQQLIKFEESLAAAENVQAIDIQAIDPSIHPILWKAQLDGLRSVRDELKAELEEYKAKYKQQVCDAYELLAGSFVEGHLAGRKLLKQVEQECPEALREVDEELEEEMK